MVSTSKHPLFRRWTGSLTDTKADATNVDAEKVESIAIVVGLYQNISDININVTC